MFVGFDTMTAVMVVTFGAGMGVVGSTIEPFSIIIASGTLYVSPMNGIVWRIFNLFINTRRYRKQLNTFLRIVVIQISVTTIQLYISLLCVF